MEKKLHTGKLISECIKSNDIRTVVVSRKHGIALSSLHRFSKSSHLLSSNLWKLCYALEYNFFADIAEMLPDSFKKSSINPKDLEIQRLQKENEDLKIQITLLKELLSK